jgi:LysR family transcriptional activator of dmlA
VNNYPLLDDLKVLTMVVRKGSLSSAAREMGVSPAYITKRLQILEATLKAKLLHRSTRHIALTTDGERTYQWAIDLLGQTDSFIDEFSDSEHTVRGALNIACAFGLGPVFIAPAISALVSKYPELNVRFEVFDRPVNLVAEGFDIDLVQGAAPPVQHIAKQLTSNIRVLCASPGYIEKFGTPKTLTDLTKHNCLVIRSRDHPFGVWTLKNGNHLETVKVSGMISSNNGEAIYQWGLDGFGIMLRSLWKVKDALDSGALVRVLPNYEQEAHVWAVYSTRLSTSAKLRVCVDFLAEYLSKRVPV